MNNVICNWCNEELFSATLRRDRCLCYSINERTTLEKNKLHFCSPKDLNWYWHIFHFNARRGRGQWNGTPLWCTIMALVKFRIDNLTLDGTWICYAFSFLWTVLKVLGGYSFYRKYGRFIAQRKKGPHHGNMSMKRPFLLTILNSHLFFTHYST